MSEDATVENMVRINLPAPIHLMRVVVPTMVAQRQGTIVDIGSLAGEIAHPGHVLGDEVRPAGHHRLGPSRSWRARASASRSSSRATSPPRSPRGRGRMPGPDIVARAVEDALRRPRRRVIILGTYRLAVLFTNGFPRFADRRYDGEAARPSG